MQHAASFWYKAALTRRPHGVRWVWPLRFSVSGSFCTELTGTGSSWNVWQRSSEKSLVDTGLLGGCCLHLSKVTFTVSATGLELFIGFPYCPFGYRPWLRSPVSSVLGHHLEAWHRDYSPQRTTLIAVIFFTVSLFCILLFEVKADIIDLRCFFF